MGWFDNYSQSYFKTLRDGRLAFYPYLVAPRGYVVSGEQKAPLRRFMFGAGIFGSVLGVMVGEAILLWNLPINLILMILSLSLLSAGYYGGLRWLTRNLERAPADERLTLGERLRTQAQHSSWILLWFMEIWSLLLMAGGLDIAATGKGGYPPLFGLVATAFFGLLAWAAGYMLSVKSSKPL